ncbi:hypothetical protein C0993_005795, partial [Termitomyces sp. T159_Od127]
SWTLAAGGEPSSPMPRKTTTATRPDAPSPSTKPRLAWSASGKTASRRKRHGSFAPTTATSPRARARTPKSSRSRWPRSVHACVACLPRLTPPHAARRDPPLLAVP